MQRFGYWCNANIFRTNQASFLSYFLSLANRKKALTMYLVEFRLYGIDGSVVECSPATRAARVRFPVDAIFWQMCNANNFRLIRLAWVIFLKLANRKKALNIYLVEFRLHGIDGSVVECSPATRAARVRFPVDPTFWLLMQREHIPNKSGFVLESGK